MAAKWAAQGVETNSKTGPESRPGAIGAASLRRRDGSGAPRAPPVKGWRIGRTTGKISVIARATETHPHPTLALKGRAFQAHAVGIPPDLGRNRPGNGHHSTGTTRSEEHTSELQSLMRISYAVFCLKKNKHEIKSTA